MIRQRYRMWVFDRPVVKDWAFWHAVGWSLAVGISTIFQPPKGSTSPLWLDVLGVAAVTFFIVGWPVAGVRRILRIARARRGPDDDPLRLPPPLERGGQWPPPSEAVPVKPLMTPPPWPVLPAQTPIPLGSYSGGEIRESDALAQARLVLPYPVARAARAVQTAQDPLEQYQYLLDLGEALTLTLGMLSASWLRQHAREDPALRMLHDNYHLRGVSQGHWHAVTRAAEKAMAASGNPLPGFVEGVRSRRDNSGGLDALQLVVAERNRAAHGARPHNRGEAAVRISDLAPVVITAVDRTGFMGDTSWVLVEGVALRRHDKRWNVRFRKAMGDHPDFDAVTQVIDHPLSNDTFYVMAEPEPLDLTPMLVIRYCDQCRQPEVCHADRVDKAGVSLKSFARGHQVFDRELVQEMESLIPHTSSDGAEGA